MCSELQNISNHKDNCKAKSRGFSAILSIVSNWADGKMFPIAEIFRFLLDKVMS